MYVEFFLSNDEGDPQCATRGCALSELYMEIMLMVIMYGRFYLYTS